MKKKDLIVVAIEGIDGAGKTTLIKEVLKSFPNNIAVYNRTEKGKFLDKIISYNVMQKKTKLQVPIYLFLSYKNYLKFLFELKNKKIVIMDRCFLSNICYFYPSALNNKKHLQKLLSFEINLYPQVIYIVDVDAHTGQQRDKYKKSVEWLKDTRDAYLSSIKSDICKWIPIKIIENNLPTKDRVNIIKKYIEGELKNGN